MHYQDFENSEIKNETNKKKIGICKIIFICLFILILILIFYRVIVQPEITDLFINPTPVIINGYDFDCMEPFISSDGKFLFFNSLNDGKNTSLLYASYINDTYFEFKGQINNVNGIYPHLDAVPSMDNNNFFFITTRDYPNNFENLMKGIFDNGTINNLTRVNGDFYIKKSGWLIMDAEISRDGNYLFVVNSFFLGLPIPFISEIRITQKINNSFLTLLNNKKIMRNINLHYANYAPSLSNDGNILSFTRMSFLSTDILLSIKNNITNEFEKPKRLNLPGLVEAITFTKDDKRIYYHYKPKNKYEIFTMERKNIY